MAQGKMPLSHVEIMHDLAPFLLRTHYFTGSLDFRAKNESIVKYRDVNSI